MSINNDQILANVIELWAEADAGTVDTPRAIRTLIANTSTDRSEGDIENFLFELTEVISKLKSTAFTAKFGNGLDKAVVTRVVIESVRSLTTLPPARTNIDNQYTERLAGIQPRLSTDSDLIFRVGHMSFYDHGDIHVNENEPSVIPSSLLVRRSHLNKKIETLRSPSSPVAVAQDPVETITVDLVFPNIQSVNQHLRELYSMIQMLPVLLIESPLLTKAFINEADFPYIYSKSVAQYLKNNQSVARDVESIAADAVQSLDKAIELSRTDDPFVDLILDRIKAEAEVYNKSTEPTDGVDANTILSKVSTAIGVAVKNISIQTIPNSPGALMARVTFTRANIPMLEKGQPVYLDDNGNPTHSPDQAGYLKEYSRTLIKENIAKDRYLEKIDLNSPGWDDFRLQWTNIYGQSKNLTLNSDKTVESQISLQTGFKIATLNLLNSSAPLVQHMGRANVEGIIIIETTDINLIEDLSKAKADIKHEARDGLLKRNSAEVIHPLLNMMGVRRISITDIAFQETQENPELMTITLGVVENTFNITDGEAIHLESGSVDTGTLDVFWSFVRRVDQYSDTLKLRGSSTYNQWYKSLSAAEKKTYNIVQTLLHKRESETSAGLLQYPLDHDYISFTNMFGATLPSFNTLTSERHLFRAGLNRLYFKNTTDKKQTYYSSDSVKDMGSEDLAESLRLAASSVNYISSTNLNSITNNDDVANILRTAGYRVTTQGGRHTIKAAPIPDGLWDAILYVITRGDGDRSSKKIWHERSPRTAMATLNAMLGSSTVKNLVDLPGLSGDNRIVYRMRKHIEETTTNEIRAKNNKAATNFADLILPTYRELFGSKKDSEGELFYKKFAPTYADLGVRPKLSDASAFVSTADAYNSCAHELDDLVPPGSFFYRPRAKRFMEEALEEKHHQDADDFESIGRVVRIPIDSSELLQTAGAETFEEVTTEHLYEIVERRLDNDEDNSWHEASARYKENLKNKYVKAIDIVTADGMPVIMFTKDINGAAVARRIIGKRNIFKSTEDGVSLDPQSPQDLTRMLNSTVHNTPDNISNMDKSFPAIRIYLVEEDRSFRTLFDDIYAVSAIESVSVNKDMKDADTAIIKLSNTSGYLSEDSFIPKGVDSRVDDDGEPFLQRFKVTYGTHIVIKMGYAARPEDLKTVFTGSIAEIGGGESITIIAQSFKTELFNDIGLFAEKYSWDNINRPHLRNVINHILKKNGDAPHLGSEIDLRDPHSDEARALLLGLYGANSGFDTRWYYNPIDYAAYAAGGRTVTDIGRNIYYDSNTYFGTEFAIPTMPAMDAIDECVKYMPNFIADVVPYGTDATLFVGDPSSHYRYKETTREEDELFAVAAGKEDKDVSGFGGPFTDLINGFINSPQYIEYAEVVSEVADQARSGEIESASYLIANGEHIASEKDVFGLVQEQEKNLVGLSRLAFSHFYGFTPDTTAWPRGFQGNWRETIKAMLSPWRNKYTATYTNAYYNAIAYLNDDASEQTKHTVETASVDSMLNPALREAESNKISFILGSPAKNINSDTVGRQRVVDYIYARAIYYRIFMEYLCEYMQKAQDLDYTAIQKARVFGAELAPGYKSFRDYHHITSEQDIIENNIVASDSEMWTAAALKAPAVIEADGFWRSLINPVEALKGLTDPDIFEGNLVQLARSQDYILWPPASAIPGSKREGLTFRGLPPNSRDILKIFHEPNALSGHAAANALNHRLCEGMSLMYRGNIVIAGKVIKPHDIVHIRDGKNNMMGNFVADRVTHNFDPNYGWTTTIIPKALTFHNSHFAHLNSSFLSGLWAAATSDEVSSIMLWLSLAALVVSVAATGGAAIPAAIPLFFANMGRAAATGAARVLPARMMQLAASAGTRVGGVGSAVSNNLLRHGSAYVSPYYYHFTLGALLGDKFIVKTLRDMTSAAVQQSVGGNKYPVLVNTLIYQGRPYTAGFKPTEYDFDTRFWENFSNMLSDLGDGADELFRGTPRKVDINKLTDSILESGADG